MYILKYNSRICSQVYMHKHTYLSIYLSIYLAIDEPSVVLSIRFAIFGMRACVREWVRQGEKCWKPLHLDESSTS